MMDAKFLGFLCSVKNWNTEHKRRNNLGSFDTQKDIRGSYV